MVMGPLFIVAMSNWSESTDEYDPASSIATTPTRPIIVSGAASGVDPKNVRNTREPVECHVDARMREAWLVIASW
jgi:hypothetical protein